MWAAQSLRLLRNQFFMTSAGMGAMGYALPAAMGACFAAGKKSVVVIAGDGGFQLNIQELQTVVHHRLPLKLIILNNNSLGMIRQFQDSYFDSRHQSTAWGYSAPNFEKIGEAYGICSKTISETNQIDEGMQFLFSDADKPVLLQVMIHSKANAYPKIAFGKPITEMEPFSQPVEMEGT
ncbi:MAG: thiamine pyrophosphate-binding protein, partial [Gammaproteobacteria bacterium]|nr:thiamine pyrophosphate-binding protein [Gammaproteobacteria bacterium]